MANAQEATQPVLGQLAALKAVGAEILAHDEGLGVGYAYLNSSQQEGVSHILHEQGRCGGFEVMPFASKASGQDAIAQLARHSWVNYAYGLNRPIRSQAVEYRPAVAEALTEASDSNIRAIVEWLSAFPSRNSKLADPNQHVVQLEAKLREMLKDFKGVWSVEQVAHTRTKQRSLRVRLEGTQRPSEILVLGGHLDSVNMWGGKAPGADDNASGSASLLEALRVIATRGPVERTVEFYWYAAEESGLVGSAEIASQYKASAQNVIAVLQLDMTMFPGSGELVIASMEDFTSAWLRDYLVALNSQYLNVRIVTDRCGYGCSDHASWHRQGYPTLMPFEADMRSMNSKIHGSGDVIDASSNFRHSLIFTKIAIAMILDLGNSLNHQPYSLGE